MYVEGCPMAMAAAAAMDDVILPGVTSSVTCCVSPAKCLSVSPNL